MDLSAGETSEFLMTKITDNWKSINHPNALIQKWHHPVIASSCSWVVSKQSCSSTSCSKEKRRHFTLILPSRPYHSFIKRERRAGGKWDSVCASASLIRWWRRSTVNLKQLYADTLWNFISCRFWCVFTFLDISLARRPGPSYTLCAIM